MGIDNESPTNQNEMRDGPKPDLTTAEPKLLGEETWQAANEKPLPKELFGFELKCAQIIAAKTGLPLEKVINKYAPFLYPEMWERDRKEYKSEDFAPLESPDKIADAAHESVVKNTKGEITPYSFESPHGSIFGCFACDYDELPTIRIHFINAEFGDSGPLTKEKIDQRKKELTDLFNSIKLKHPEATEVRGASWLYHLEAYRRLLPPSYTATREPDDDPKSWKQGTKIWGQFLSSDYKLKLDQAEKFLAQLGQIPEGLSETEFDQTLLKALPYTPLKVHAPIEEFYKFYSVE